MLQVERIDAEGFRTETNLRQILGISPEQVHDLVMRGLLGVGGLHVRLELMDRYEAVTGFQPQEIPLFDAKLGDAARRLNADVDLTQVERVLDLAGLPDVHPDPSTDDIDLARLIEILDTDQAREFRAWLRDAGSLDDTEIQHQMSRMRELLRRAVHSKLSKGVRWTAVTALGLKLRAPEAVSVSAADAFVLDRLVAKPGRLAFVSDLFPTVYKQ